MVFRKRGGYVYAYQNQSTPPTMIIYGGDQGGPALPTGWAMNTNTAQWTPLPTAPAARTNHTAVAVGLTMIVWGGEDAPGGAPLGDGAIYDLTP